MTLASEIRARLPLKRFLLGLAVTAALFWWMARAMDEAVVRRLWQSRNPAPIAAAALAYSCLMGFRFIRYRATGAGLDSKRLMTVTSLHSFLNRVLPARGGELAYGYLVKRLGGATFTAGMLGLLQIRILDLVAVAAIVALALARFAGDVGMPHDRALHLAVAALGVCTVGYLAIGPLVGLGTRALRALAPARAACGRFGSMVEHLDELAREIAATPLRVRGLLIVASAGCWLSIFVCYWLILRGFGLALPLSTVVVGASVANLASSIPVTAVGSFGTLEAAWGLAFAALGVEKSLAFASAWAVSLVTLAFGACYSLGGWIAFTRLDPQAARNRSPSS